MKRIGIIGAGRFGSSLALSLAEHGAEVLLIDQQREIVREYSEFVEQALEGDAANIHTLEEAGMSECDAVVIAIGGNLEGSVMATMNCKELKVKKVIAKANSEMHGKILRRVGADVVVYPNRDCALRLSNTLTSKGSVDLFSISDGFSVAEIDPPEAFRNKTLAESQIRNKYNVSVLCVRRLADNELDPREVIIPDAQFVIRGDDKLLIFGDNKAIDALIS